MALLRKERRGRCFAANLWRCCCYSWPGSPMEPGPVCTSAALWAQGTPYGHPLVITKASLTPPRGPAARTLGEDFLGAGSGPNFGSVWFLRAGLGGRWHGWGGSEPQAPHAEGWQRLLHGWLGLFWKTWGLWGFFGGALWEIGAFGESFLRAFPRWHSSGPGGTSF